MKNLKLTAWIVFVLVAAVFLYSWSKSGILVTTGAFLTLFIFSFLYKDNPYYKFAEHLFVGVSAAYWMVMGFWNTLVPNLIAKLWPSMVKGVIPALANKPPNYYFLIPLALGILMLMRMSPAGGWISRWALAFIVGTTAGLNLVRYLRSDFIQQVNNTMVPLVRPTAEAQAGDTISNAVVFLLTLLLIIWLAHAILAARRTPWGPRLGILALVAVLWFLICRLWLRSGLIYLAGARGGYSLGGLIVFLGVLSGLVYFFFSKEHKGLFGGAARLGVMVLMLTFGAGFGYTVMARISLLAGRFTALFGDWLGYIK